ncbi:hypothetical protein PIB30_011125 [Stylosanthes scabra]|uniref:CCHC-type domain-containing protein n=1 Tax=Stylosanthes scabra TaxID=79078 RepID=A0ABU6Q5Q2_9FABA|nr:hypothetical protein [Stylosanthes scabra]
MHRNGGYSPDDFVHKSLTMESVRATYSYTVHPVPSEEYWNPTGCGGIQPPPIVRPAGRPRQRRMKDHVDMIIGNKVRKTCQVTCAKCGEQGHYFKTCKGAPKDPNWKTKFRQTKKAKSGQEGPNSGQTNNPGSAKPPMDPIEKVRKNKKKKPRVTPSSDIGQVDEVDYSQSAPTPEKHAAPDPMPGPSHSPPAHPLPAKFRMKQPIVRPPSTASANPKELHQFTFMPTPGFRPPRHI